MARALGSQKPYQRKQRVAVQIQQALSHYLLTRALDPRLKQVTIVDVDCSPDLRQAMVTIDLRDADQLEAVMHALHVACQHLRYYLAQCLSLRVSPALQFRHNQCVDKPAQNRLNHLLSTIELAPGLDP